jgi:hypothetical protein
LAKANPKKPKYRANAAQMQPILQLNAAFIGLKPGEGRAKEGFARTRNLNGGPTSRNKYKVTGDVRNGERQVERQNRATKRRTK